MAEIPLADEWSILEDLATTLFARERAIVYRNRGVGHKWELHLAPNLMFPLGDSFQEAYTTLATLALLATPSPPRPEPTSG